MLLFLNFPHHNNFTKQCCKHVDDCLLEKSQEEFRGGGCCPKLPLFLFTEFRNHPYLISPFSLVDLPNTLPEF